MPARDVIEVRAVGPQNMTLDITNAAVVVLAEGHRPSILHPSFLKEKSIVPQEWEPDPTSVISMSHFSVVKFTSGVTFMMDPMKLQVLDESPPKDDEERLPKYVGAFVKAIGDVKWTAVGINLVGFVACPNATEFLLDRFIKPGIWTDTNLKPTGCGLRFKYDVDGAEMGVVLDIGNRSGPKDNEQGLLVAANYHKSLGASSEAIAAVEMFHQRLGHFRSFAKSLIGLEG